MKKKSSFFDTSLILHGLITIALIVNVGLLFYLTDNPDDAVAAGTLKVLLLTAPDCESCFDLEPLRDYLVEGGVEEKNIEEVDYTSSSGKKLIKRHNITQVPTAVVTGDFSNNQYIQELIGTAGEVRDDVFVLTKLQPPFLDLEEDKIRGLFEVTYLGDDTCEECYDIGDHKIVLDRLALKPATEKFVDISSDEGKVLLEEYFIVAVPTIILRGDLEVYERLFEIWQEVGSVEEDGSWVLRQGVASMGVYKSLPDGEIITPEANPPEEAE